MSENMIIRFYTKQIQRHPEIYVNSTFHLNCYANKILLVIERAFGVLLLK